MNTNIQSAIIVLILLGTAISCQKDFLDTKPNIALSTVNTLEDCQLLLNNEGLFNNFTSPGLGTLSSDEFYVTSEVWNSDYSQVGRNAYVFAKNIYPIGETIEDWSGPYKQIYTSNVVLDALDRIEITPQQKRQLDAIRGTALFYRSWAFFNLLQTFTMPFDSADAKSTLGIPLRLSADLNIKSIRASLQDCYNKIIEDVGLCTSLLPNEAPYVTRPTIAAANAFLARVYLCMGNYQQALRHADASLKLKSDLIDFNTIDTTSPFSLSTDQSQYPLIEELYHSTLMSYGLMTYTQMIVDTILYSLYENNDIRKPAYFGFYNGNYRFKGSYEFRNFGIYFDGLATDEMYLIRAESNARLGNANEAMKDLNILLKNRYRTGTYTDRTSNDANDALEQILVERRKELCFRGLRWMDLRRLNKDQKHATTIKHVINGTIYTLPPNDPKYVFPIPDAEIKLSGIEQNPR